MPYRPHSEYTPPYAVPPSAAKTRPSAAWFVVGGALLLVAALVFGIAIFHFVRAIARSDAVFPGTGVHQVTLPAHTERAVFVAQEGPAARCSARDATGLPVVFRPPGERFTYNEWVAVSVFDSGDGRLTFTCASRRGGQVRIARIPSGGDVAQLGLLGILFPLALGGLGFVILLVTTILWFSRRPTTPPPGAPPGWHPGLAPGAWPGPPPPPPGSPPLS
jgi:hypothetical protein